MALHSYLGASNVIIVTQLGFSFSCRRYKCSEVMQSGIYTCLHILVEYQTICWNTEYSFHTATASVRQNALDRAFIFTVNSIELVHERYHRCWSMFLHEMLFIHSLEVDWFISPFSLRFFPRFLLPWSLDCIGRTGSPRPKDSFTFMAMV